MKSSSLRALLLSSSLAAASIGQVHAQNPFFANSDLILFFQKPGVDATIYVGLGSAPLLYRGSAAGPTADRAATDIININAALTTAFGAGWASDTEIYAGAVAARSSSGSAVVNGDHNTTVYGSRTRTDVGVVGQPGSAPWDFRLSGANTACSQQIVAFNNSFETRATTQVAQLNLFNSLVDDQNPFISVALGIQDIAFAGFPGGVQQRGSASSFAAFGPIASPEILLDLWRVAAFDDSETVGVEVSGVKRLGSYEGTIVVDTLGNVSFVTTDPNASSNVCVDNITTTAGTNANTKKVTIAFTATGNVDVYSSTDLQTWGAAISTNVAASPFILDNIADDKRFFVLVPAGQPYPPTP